MAPPSPKKTPMREQPALDRIRNFLEVPFGYSEEEAVLEARRCIQCRKPLCMAGCPVEIDIPRFIAAVADRRFHDAARIIKEKNILPAVCGRVCPQEDQCEKLCVLKKKMEPVAIGRLERFCADWEAARAVPEAPKRPMSTGKKVAVVGTGPAGLTVAYDLSLLGHAVTLFEALHKAGGVLVYGIPEFRLSKRIVSGEIDQLLRMGVPLELDVVVGTTLTVDELLRDFDAVFLGTGAGLPWFLNVPGENLNGIYSSNEYLTRTNLMMAYRFPEVDTPIVRGRRVATVGGGNVAMDSARTAARLGAEKSMIIYRRSRAEMPARLEEIHHAEEEGIEFHLLTNPTAFLGDESGRVSDVECIRMELGAPDDSGRRRPIPIPDSHFRIPVDVVIVAIGNSPNPLISRTTPGLEMGKDGVIRIDEATGKTSKPGVFAGGDVATGAATVISAMGAGKKTARAIHAFLTGRDQEKKPDD